MMLASGAFIYLALRYEVGRLTVGSDIYTAPPNWLFFWGCVAIFALSAVGLARAVRRKPD